MAHFSVEFMRLPGSFMFENQQHTVQYRHWDQILADMAGHANHTVVCQDNDSQLVSIDEVADEEQLGICAWQLHSAK